MTVENPGTPTTPRVSALTKRYSVWYVSPASGRPLFSFRSFRRLRRAEGYAYSRRNAATLLIIDNKTGASHEQP